VKMPPALRRYAAPAITLLCAVIAWIVLTGAPSYIQSIAVLVGIYFLLSSSLNLVVGYTDLISFGQAAFFAIGAYVSALAAIYWHTGLLLGAVIGAVVAALFAAIVVSASRQLSGVYFALATMAAAEIVRIVLLNWTDFTRGPLGLSLPFGDKTLIPGVKITQSSFVSIVFAVVILATIAMWFLLRSDIGSRMISVRQNAALSASVGVSPSKYRFVAFCISGGIAAVAGSLYAFNYGILTPDLSGLHYSALALLMVIFGGRGTLLGPLIGAAVFVILPDLIDIQGALGEVLFAAVLFIVVLVMPRGVLGTIGESVRKRRARRIAAQELRETEKVA
jgi:branched-chain amino acid transport system permease protein